MHLDADGYQTVKLCSSGKAKEYRVHRLVAIAFIENPMNKPVVNHIDCNRSNNNSTNLNWCTIQENNQHTINMGRSNSSGSNSHLSKINETTAKMIICLGNKGFKRIDIASNLGVSRAIVRDVQNRKTWKNI